MQQYFVEVQQQLVVAPVQLASELVVVWSSVQAALDEPVMKVDVMQLVPMHSVVKMCRFSCRQ